MALNCGGRPADNYQAAKSYLMVNATTAAGSSTSAAAPAPNTVATSEPKMVSAGLLSPVPPHMLAGPCQLVNGFQFRASSSGSPTMAHPYYPHAVRQLPDNAGNTNIEGSSSMMHPEDLSSMDLDQSFMNQPAEKKRRLTNEQVKSLEESFDNESKLEPERKNQLAQELGLQPRQVAVWFQNRRARCKTKQLERDYGILKAQYEAVKSEKDKLEAEVAKLRSLLGLDTSAGMKGADADDGDDSDDDDDDNDVEKQPELQSDQDDQDCTPKLDMRGHDGDCGPTSKLKGISRLVDVNEPNSPPSIQAVQGHLMIKDEQKYVDGDALSTSDYSDQTDVVDGLSCVSPKEARPSSSNLDAINSHQGAHLPPHHHHHYHHHHYQQQQQLHHEFSNINNTQQYQFASAATKLPLCATPQLLLHHMITHVKLEDGFVYPEHMSIYNDQDYSFHSTIDREHDIQEHANDSMLCFNSWPHIDS